MPDLDLLDLEQGSFHPAVYTCRETGQQKCWQSQRSSCFAEQYKGVLNAEVELIAFVLVFQLAGPLRCQP